MDCFYLFTETSDAVVVVFKGLHFRDQIEESVVESIRGDRIDSDQSRLPFSSRPWVSEFLHAYFVEQSKQRMYYVYFSFSLSISLSLYI